MGKLVKTVFGINTHRSKLVRFERLSILANAFLGENGAALAVVNFDDGSKKKIKPPKQGKDKNAECNVKSSL